MYLKDLPPGIHDWEVDRQFGGDDESVVYRIPEKEVERRRKQVEELGLSEKNPHIRMFVNGR